MTHTKGLGEKGECAYCYKEFISTGPHQKYCSLSCKNKRYYAANTWNLYDVMGGDGNSPVYVAEGVWAYPDGSTRDD